MSELNWNRAAPSNLPPEGQVVLTISPGGFQYDLMRQGNLWFYPDGSMHVYYTPEFWREKEREAPHERA